MTRKRTLPTRGELQKRINKALTLAAKSHWYMEYPDNNHTMYFLNEIVRVLTPEKYERMAQKHPIWNFGEDPED